MQVPQEKPGYVRIPVFTMEQLAELSQKAGGDREKVLAAIDDLKEYINAIYSFDRQKIENYMKKNDIPIPENDLEFWMRINVTILSRRNSPKDYRQYAKDWLILNGFSDLAMKYDAKENA